LARPRAAEIAGIRVEHRAHRVARGDHETATWQAKRGLAAELVHLASRVMNAHAKALRREGARHGRVSVA